MATNIRKNLLETPRSPLTDYVSVASSFLKFFKVSHGYRIVPSSCTGRPDRPGPLGLRVLGSTFLLQPPACDPFREPCF